MQPLAHTSATSSLSASAVNLNLGAIGRLESYHVGALGGPRPSLRDECVALAPAHTGLPRPPRDVDCRVIPTPDCPNLLVLAGTAHQVAYYVITNATERSAYVAMAGALKKHRLELVLTSDNSRPWWSAMRFENEAEEQLGRELQARKGLGRAANDLWRDKLGMLVADLPQRFAHHDAAAARCTHHAAILVSGNRSTFLNAVDRCARALACSGAS